MQTVSFHSTYRKTSHADLMGIGTTLHYKEQCFFLAFFHSPLCLIPAVILFPSCSITPLLCGKLGSEVVFVLGYGTDIFKCNFYGTPLHYKEQSVDGILLDISNTVRQAALKVHFGVEIVHLNCIMLCMKMAYLGYSYLASKLVRLFRPNKFTSLFI